MRYEIVKSHSHQPDGSKIDLPIETPLEIRITPQDTDVSDFFVALIQSAYEMASENAGKSQYLKEKDALKFILPENFGSNGATKPTGIHAYEVKGIRTELLVLEPSKKAGESNNKPAWYTMYPSLFATRVGSVDELFRRAQMKLG